MDELSDSQALGRTGEEAAAAYLRRNAYRIIARGFRMFRGEIDIIAYDGPTLVFVEVKTRRTEVFGRPEEAVTPAKQEQVRRIATAFLMKNRIAENLTPCRFDVLSVVPMEGRGFRVRHIKNAF
jgi:putative endonuclease